MTTTPVVPTPTPTPAQITIAISGGTLNEVLTLLSDALAVLSAFPPTALPAGLASVILGIVVAAVNRIQSQTGKAIDLTTIPTEALLP
jgi:hypothetical protein